MKTVTVLLRVSWMRATETTRWSCRKMLNGERTVIIKSNVYTYDDFNFISFHSFNLMDKDITLSRQKLWGVSRTLRVDCRRHRSGKCRARAALSPADRNTGQSRRDFRPVCRRVSAQSPPKCRRCSRCEFSPALKNRFWSTAWPWIRPPSRGCTGCGPPDWAWDWSPRQRPCPRCPGWCTDRPRGDSCRPRMLGRKTKPPRMSVSTVNSKKGMWQMEITFTNHSQFVFNKILFNKILFRLFRKNVKSFVPQRQISSR